MSHPNHRKNNSNILKKFTTLLSILFLITHSVSLECKKGQYQSKETPSKCLPCKSHCQICNESSICSVCSSGNALFQGECFNQAPRSLVPNFAMNSFYSCSEKNICNCPHGEFFLTDFGSLEYSNIQKISEINHMWGSSQDNSDSSKFHQIHDGYVFQFEIESCHFCEIEHCLRCSSPRVCKQCPSRYYLNNKLTCSPCPSFVSSCEFDAVLQRVKVLDCLNNYHYNPQTLKCQANIKHCARQEGPDCLQCTKGYILSKNKRACLVCGDFCLDCPNEIFCSVCQEGFFFDYDLSKGWFKNFFND